MESEYQALRDNREKTRRKMCQLIVICVVFILAEVAGGVAAHSLAIISDSVHMFTDLISFVITIVSLQVSLKKANPEFSYGYYRVEIIGAMVNLFLIWTLTIFLIYEAVLRIVYAEAVTNPLLMLLVAFFGLIVNLGMAKILHQGIDPEQDHAHEK
jgi:zinc transporter 2